MNPVRLLLKAPPPSEERAATTIQAFYRGYGVRRTRPLQQLATIYQVRSDLKSHMQRLAEPAQFDKLCGDSQERVKWSECAMALLLRLDSVQGAHVDVRDIRKSVTKEVVTFQEIIDSTTKDVVSAKGKGIQDAEVHFSNLFFALQHLGWIFVSSMQLDGKGKR